MLGARATSRTGHLLGQYARVALRTMSPCLFCLLRFATLRGCLQSDVLLLLLAAQAAPLQRFSCDPPSSPWDFWGGDAVGRVRLVYMLSLFCVTCFPLTSDDHDRGGEF